MTVKYLYLSISSTKSYALKSTSPIANPWLGSEPIIYETQLFELIIIKYKFLAWEHRVENFIIFDFNSSSTECDCFLLHFLLSSISHNMGVTLVGGLSRTGFGWVPTDMVQIFGAYSGVMPDQPRVLQTSQTILDIFRQTGTSEHPTSVTPMFKSRFYLEHN